MPRKPTRPNRRRARTRCSARAAGHLVHAFVSPAAIKEEGPLTLVKAKGIFVWDDRGRKYIDGLASLWNVAIGHGRPEIARRVAAQIRELEYAPTLLGFSSPPAARLAAELARLAPAGLTRVLFTSGGSEANETILRLARVYWRLRGFGNKHKIVTLERSYHGSSAGAASLTGLHYFHRYYEPMLPGIVRMPNPYCYRCPLGLRYPQCHLGCADELERIVEREGAKTVAAFLAEPVQGVGGVIVPPPGYFARIREICDRHDVLLAVDEVITGFGRLGTWFGIKRWGAVPDLIAFAKSVTSGYLPLGGVLFREDIYQTLVAAGRDFVLHHGFTYSGHPVACAAALENLAIMRRERMLLRCRRLAPRFAAQLEGLRGLPIVGDVRVAGLMGAVELVADGQTKAPFAAEERVPWRVRQAALRRGVIVRGSGDCIVLCPPLCIEPEQLDALVAAVADAIREVAPELGRGNPAPVVF